MNPKIAKSMEEMDPKPIQDLAFKIKNSGAGIIDINLGLLHKACDKMMAFLINAVQDVTDLQFCLDTPNPEAIKIGLTVCTNKPIINGFSLEPHKMEKILLLAVESEAGLDLVLLNVFRKRNVAKAHFCDSIKNILFLTNTPNFSKFRKN
jgi:5-methyltetrahydrofolate corrinoid/iron sulfur protein methyltransferase